MDDNIDVPTDEKIDNTLYEAANNLPPAEMSSKKRGFSKPRKDADLLMNKSEEPIKRIKQTTEQNKQILEKEGDDLEDVDLFFENIAVIVKRFSAKRKVLAKLKMYLLIAELLEEDDINKQPKQP